MTIVATPKSLFRALALIAALSVGRAASAQSDSDLRKLNQQLATQVADLQKELDAVKKENASLKQRIAQLEQQLTAARKSGPTAAGPTPVAPLDPEKVTIDESVPFASPRSIFKSVLASHDKTMGDADMGQPNDGKRRAYMKKLEGWKAAADRQFRGPVVWHVKLAESQTTDRGRMVKLTAVDPVTGAELGAPFEVLLSRFVADRLAVYETRGDLGTMILRGTFVPDIRIDEQRTGRGTFDNPPFIGPFTEYSSTVDAISLRPVKEDEQTPATQPAATGKKPATPPANPSPPPAPKTPGGHSPDK